VATIIRSLQALIITVICIIGLPLALRWLLPYIAPFVLAVMLAALIDGPVNKLATTGLSRGWSAAICLFTFVLAAVGGTVLILVKLLGDANKLVSDLPALGRTIQDNLASWLANINQLHAELPTPLADSIRRLGPQVAGTMDALLRGMLTAIASLPATLAGITVVVLTAFFLARDGRQLADYVLNSLPESWRKRISKMNRDIFTGIAGFMRAQIILVTLSSCLTTLAFVMFRLPYAWLLGALAGLFDFLPFIGPSAVFIPVILYHWLTGALVVAAGLTTAWLFTLIIRQFYEPHLVKNQAGLHPVTSLVAIYVGIKVFGFMGLFVGPLCALASKALWLSILRPVWCERIK